MKKNPKFNIIEAGRICSPEEMGKITGGCHCVDSCGGDNPFQACASDGQMARHFTCASEIGGYNLNCDSFAVYNLSCGLQVNYDVCGTAGHSIHCPSREAYNM